MNQIISRLQPIINMLKRYYIVVFIAVIGLVYGYIIQTSSNLVRVEPSEVKIAENYQGAKRPKIDKGTTNKLNDLVDRSITLRTIIDDARKNPFQE